MPQPRKPRQSGKPRQSPKHVQTDQSPGSQSPGNQPDSHGKEPESTGSRQSTGSPQSTGKSAAASGTASRAAAGSSRLHIADPGPAFEPRELPAEAVAGDVVDAPGIAGVPLLAEQWWTPERAEYLVKGQGAITHALIGVGETDWVWQPAELAAVAPPLANSLNQIEPLRRFAPYADSIGALMGVAAYVGRSRRERAAVLAAGGPPREVPVTGVDAAGEPADAESARRSQLVDRVLGRRRPAPEPEPDNNAGEAGSIEWRVG